jgi:hypothetical protein
MRWIFITAAILIVPTSTALADLPGSSQPSDGTTQRRIGNGLRVLGSIFGGMLRFSGDYSDEPPSRLTIEGQVGLGTPLGTGGISASLAATQWLDVALGVGRGAAGLQIAAMARVHPRHHGERMFFGVGVSQGDYEGPSLRPITGSGPAGDLSAPTLQDARWMNLETGSEIGKLGFFARMSFGVGWRFSDSGCLLDGDECATPPKLWRLMPYTGLTLGYRY